MRETTLDADAHQDVPPGAAGEALGWQVTCGAILCSRRCSCCIPPLPGHLAGGVFDRDPLLPSTSFDLHLSVMPTTDGLSCWLTYSRDLFDGATVEGCWPTGKSCFVSLLQIPTNGSTAWPRSSLPNLIDLQLVSSFTADPLVDILALWMAELGVLSRIRTAPAGQVFQPLLDPQSGLAQNRWGGMWCSFASATG